jgi:transcriptional regulator with XRE-family HTH domain
MDFKERLRAEREKAGLTQVELAHKAGLADRTIQNYERGTRAPQTIKIISDIAKVLGVTAEYLLGEGGMLIVQAREKGGAKASRDIQELVTEVSGLFAGGELSDEDKDAAIRALTHAYWESKEINKKYTPKKYSRSPHLLFIPQIRPFPRKNHPNRQVCVDFSNSHP